MSRYKSFIDLWLNGAMVVTALTIILLLWALIYENLKLLTTATTAFLIIYLIGALSHYIGFDMYELYEKWR